MSGGPRILYFGKRGDDFAQAAHEFFARQDCDVEAYFLVRGERIPDAALEWRGDYVISYLCPPVLPAELLARANRAVLNFHPGPPDYPGIGCVNFAIYEGATQYGATCHHMAQVVDSGSVVVVSRFPVSSVDTVRTVLTRTYVVMFEMFLQIAPLIIKREALPTSEERWTRPAFRRRDLEALCRLSFDMPADEVARRIRATTFPGAPGAYYEIGGYRFEFTPRKQTQVL